ncbi:MAG: glycosyltransferase family 2 protein [Cyanobacteria bacterium J06597_16]
MKKASIIIPLYNTERYVHDTLASALAQTYQNIEVIVVDDGSVDGGVDVCKSFNDPRITIIQQKNRGLSGARNTGIERATGDYIAFLDADDLWLPEKAAKHIQHLEDNPQVGASFSYSRFIDEQARPLGLYQFSKTKNITPLDFLCRTPIGNGSAAFFRKEVFDAIRFQARLRNRVEDCYFDEAFRESQDVECWMRIALQTSWIIEGIPEALTLYRVNSEGISANLTKKLDAWDRLLKKVHSYAPEQMERWEKPAKAYHYRHLARRAITLKDKEQATTLFYQAIATYWQILIEEPFRTLLTGGAAIALWILPQRLYQSVFALAAQLTGKKQKQRMASAANPLA